MTQQKGVLRWCPLWLLLQQRLRKKSLENGLETLDMWQQSLCLVSYDSAEGNAEVVSSLTFNSVVEIFEGASGGKGETIKGGGDN